MRKFLVLAAAMLPTLAANGSGLYPPIVTKSFQAHGDGTYVISIGVSNPNQQAILTGVAVTDDFPSGLVSFFSLTQSFCGGSYTVEKGRITFSGFVLGPSDSCIVSLPVVAVSPWELPIFDPLLVNTTSAPTSNETGPGIPASATVAATDLMSWYFFY